MLPPGWRLPARRTIRLERSRRRVPLTLHDLRELWAYHELMFFLIWRDVKVKYKQTALGAAWAILVPFTQMVIFTLVFNRALPHLRKSILAISDALNDELHVAPVLDFLLAFTVLVGMFVYYGRAPHWHLVVIPAFLGMALLTAFGVGLWLSALNVRYRDVPFVVPYLTQVWFFATPIVYGITALKPRTQELLALNPMTGVIDGFRWAVLGRGLPHYHVYAVSLGIALVVLLSGIWYFRRVERYFADLI